MARPDEPADVDRDLDALRADIDDLSRKVAALRDAHHDTRMVAQHAATLAEEAAHLSDHVAAATHDHHARMVEVERIDEMWAFARFIHRADVPETLTVSIVMPTHDRAMLLPRAVASVVDQQYERWELVIVDDASTDDTPAVVAQLDDPRIRSVRLDDNVGVAGARNRGLDEVAGDVVCYLDDDNLLHPTWLKSIVWCFQARPEVDRLYGAYLATDHEAQAGMPRLHFVHFDRAHLRRENIADTGVLAHRAGLTEARFDERLAFAADWDLLLTIAAVRAPFALPAIAINYEVDAAGRLSDDPRRSAELDVLRAKHGTDIGVDQRVDQRVGRRVDRRVDRRGGVNPPR